MRNYTESDYAVNKNASGIVYRFADQTIEITLADYLRENPSKTPADFAELKALSDEDYFQTDRSNYRQTWKNSSFDVLCDDKNDMFILPSAEDEVIGRSEQQEANAKRQSSAARAMDKLTEVQRRRYLMYHGQGKTIRDIAAIEGAFPNAVQESLKAAEKKIRKILASE